MTGQSYFELLKKGVKNPQRVPRFLFEQTMLSIDPWLTTPVFERDWDLLIVLDACRVDILRDIAPEYDFLNTIGSVRSGASASRAWTNLTFSKEYYEECRSTAYVTANPHSDIIRNNTPLQHLEVGME